MIFTKIEKLCSLESISPPRGIFTSLCAFMIYYFKYSSSMKKRLLLSWLWVWVVGAVAMAQVPGAVVAYSPASSGLYIGSPSICILPNGDYLASHDFFGPKMR